MFEKIRYDQRYATLPVVIRCGSFAGAARELALTPSAVSAQVRSLERELGVPLFTTVKKELVPTDKCRLVAEYIEKIQSVCRRMSDEVESVWARRGMIRLAELKKEPLILRPRESGTGRLFRSGLISAGVPEKGLRVMLEAESVDTIVRLVAGGYGLSVLSDKACAAYVAAGKIAAVRLEGMNLSRSIRILYRPGSKELQRLVGAIQKNYHTVPGENPGGQQKEYGAL